MMTTHPLDTCPDQLPLGLATTDAERVGACLRGHTGPERAVTAAQVARSLGLSDRTVRACVRELRRQGLVVAEDGTGYFLATSLQEAQAFLERFTSRSRDIFTTAQRVRAGAERAFGGQIGLELPG